MMNRHLLYFCLLAIFTMACDNIEREDRLIFEKPQPAQRVVLLEDFTGQRCVNCPKATDVIEQLLQEYGEEALVAVAIHGGPLGFNGSATITGLATEVGNEYYDYWNLEFQPVGLVDRSSPKTYPEWAVAVREELAKPTSLSLNGEAKLEGDNISISIYAYGTDGNTSGRLQLWLLEDEIVAQQVMPDGTLNHEYIHNHVLRVPINGSWGETFAIKENVSQEYQYSLPLNPLWRTDHLSVVAFVYDDSGVKQTIKIRVRQILQ